MMVVRITSYSAGKESKILQQAQKTLHPVLVCQGAVHSLVHVGCFLWHSLLPEVAPEIFLFVSLKFSILKKKSTLVAKWVSEPFIRQWVRPMQDSSPFLCHEMENHGLFSLHTCSVFICNVQAWSSFQAKPSLSYTCILMLI